MKDINAIIVCYQPDLFKLKTLLISIKNIGKVLIYKNSDFDLDIINTNISVFSSNSNIGTAKAYNLCLKNLEPNCKFVIFIDQDSFLEDLCLENLLNDGIRLDSLEKYFLISPVEIKNNGQLNGWGSLDILSLRNQEVRTSGMFVNRNIFNYIQFDEDLFVDYVDWEFCWRAISELNLKIHRSFNSKIYHELGSDFETFFFGNLNSMSPIRIYFQIINSKILLQKSYIPLLKRLFLIARIFKLFFTIWIYKDYINRYKFLFYGILDNKINYKYLK